MRLERGLSGKNPLKLHRGELWGGNRGAKGAWRGLSDPWPLSVPASSQQPRGRAQGRTQGRSARQRSCIHIFQQASLLQSPSCRSTTPMASGPDGTDHPRPGRAEGWGQLPGRTEPRDPGSLPLRAVSILQQPGPCPGAVGGSALT